MHDTQRGRASFEQGYLGQTYSIKSSSRAIPSSKDHEKDSILDLIVVAKRSLERTSNTAVCGHRKCGQY